MRIKKKRVLIFAYDGTGLGHLMRLAKIATGLQTNFLPLIVTGHEAIGNIVYEGIEFIRLPNFNSNFYHKTTEDSDDTININKIRNKSLWEIIKIFKPHVLITDFLPCGKKNELLDLILNYKCLKYLILRGEIGSLQLISNIIFTDKNNELMLNFFDRIFIACDKNITNLDSIKTIPTKIIDKFIYVGYTTLLVNESTILKIRQDRLDNKPQKWIVCSAAGGKLREKLIET